MIDHGARYCALCAIYVRLCGFLVRGIAHAVKTIADTQRHCAVWVLRIAVIAHVVQDSATNDMQACDW